MVAGIFAAAAFFCRAAAAQQRAQSGQEEVVGRRHDAAGDLLPLDQGRRQLLKKETKDERNVVILTSLLPSLRTSVD